MNRRALVLGAFSIAATGAASLLTGCHSGEVSRLFGGSAQQDTIDYNLVRGSTFAFDTYCEFTIYGGADNHAEHTSGKATAQEALTLLISECERYTALLDPYSETSDIARINAAHGAPTTVDPDTIAALTCGLEYSERFDGLFDITIGAVSMLWDFKEGIRPTDEARTNALPHVNWRNVHIDEETATVTLTDPEAKIDLGGIAKGFVADRLCQTLREQTIIEAAVISLGGNIAYFESKPDHDSWTTGIRDPAHPGGTELVGTIHTDGGSVVTSGLYERTFTDSAGTWWHILDPKTGMPVQTDLVCDTVICESSALADALSTTLFVAGSQRGQEIVCAIPDAEAYFILEDGTHAASEHWQQRTSFSKARK
ncbi:FAD:protein FMN transferase [Collinsella sp. AGMB00827]|uniref:FAD:protein FMN transferase n=2 Tax=Collinsella ureilytica TaxID=2869515 RepID=A0ABS7MJM4_9ACTN|nr:FAD:protein FMN transferase [Collinsella urealyticum]